MISKKSTTGGRDERPLPRRQSQTLTLLLQGDAEKQIAAKLEISQHTVHVYIKSLYKRFGVNSRAELLALLLRRYAEQPELKKGAHKHALAA